MSTVSQVRCPFWTDWGSRKLLADSVQRKGDCSDGSLFSLRCDWYSWYSPAPCLPHTGFHNKWPGKDTTFSPPPALLVFMGWCQRRAAHSRVMPKELLCIAVVLAFPELQLFVFGLILQNYSLAAWSAKFVWCGVQKGPGDIYSNPLAVQLQN